MRQRFVFAVFICAAACCFGQTQRPNVDSIQSFENEGNAASRYCKAVFDEHESVNQPRRFVNLGSPGGWQAWKGSQAEDAIYKIADAAMVWMKDGKAIGVRVWSRSDLNKGIKYTNYCFREDGTIARLRVVPASQPSQRNVGLEEHLVFGRDLVFLPDGRTISSSVGSRPFLQSERTIYTFLEPSVIYRSTRELPFINLLWGVE